MVIMYAVNGATLIAFAALGIPASNMTLHSRVTFWGCSNHPESLKDIQGFNAIYDDE